MGKNDGGYFKLNDRKTGSVNRFHGKTYVHFRDSAKNKTFTFSEKEFKLLIKKREDVLHLCKHIAKAKRKDRKSSSRVPHTWESSSSSASSSDDSE